MAKTRYIINKSAHEIAGSVSDHTRLVAQVMDLELGYEPFSRLTIDGVIRLSADRRGFSKYVDIDKVFNELVNSGFLIMVKI
jgi:hypothetical protein